jgi:hypothetical protein
MPNILAEQDAAADYECAIYHKLQYLSKLFDFLLFRFYAISFSTASLSLSQSMTIDFFLFRYHFPCRPNQLFR